ncbi:MAG: SurA N-terminal domain-containing protein [Kiritimatiellae bacterium]|nr:SurA N-terminal domain-containing protein [Kiritimatiellia bacterium]
MKKLSAYFLLLLCFPLFAAGEPVPVDGYAAVVNDKVITVSDVLKAMEPLERQIRETYFDDTLADKLDAAYANTLDSLIERELILCSFAAQKQFALPDSVVDSRIDEIVRNKFNNNRAEMRKVLDQEGLTFEEWRQNYKNSLIVALLREREVDGKVVITPQAVRAAYENAGEKYRIPEQQEVRAIVIDCGGTKEEDDLKLKQAEDIRRRLLNGESFEELARQASEDQKASAGGYWGWIDPDTRRTEIAAVLKTLAVGDISPVISVGDELYIFRVEGRKNSSVVPFETVCDSIWNELRKKEMKRLYDEWIERLKKNAYIKKF